jgi:two-component system, NtrC family, response regulator HydG
MQADNLKLVELVDRDNDGVIAFEDQRMLLYDADVLGMLRRELVETVGFKVARGLLIHLGYADGYRDAQTLKAAFRWDTPTEWWKAGLVLHAQEGKALVAQLTVPPDPNHFEAEVRWERCYEVEQHLRHLGPSSEPVCWTLAGYVTGHAGSHHSRGTPSGSSSAAVRGARRRRRAAPARGARKAKHPRGA